MGLNLRVRSITIAPNGDGSLLLTGESYLNLSDTAGSGGYGLRSNSSVLEVSATGGDGWGQVYHSGMTSGQGGYFESSANLSLGTRNLANSFGITEEHELGATPRLLSCVMVCTSTDRGYVVGDTLDCHAIFDKDQSSGTDHKIFQASLNCWTDLNGFHDKTRSASVRLP